MEYDTEVDTGIDSRIDTNSETRNDNRNGPRIETATTSKIESFGEEKSSLLNEWSLFWDSLKRDRPQIEGDFDQKQFELMSLSQTKDLIRALSQDRRKMNQKIESINKEIGLNSSKLESVRLAGGDEDSILKRINELNDQGQKLSLELAALDEKLRRAREFECGLTPLILE
ncbi:MAG: hypothetical protein JNM39_13115 [Bdellovibrionaceae bacterium]|nr:hypothetical protein [Pseudobdellovibrionaceae bacterium]